MREPSTGATDQRSAAAVMKMKTLVFEPNQCGFWRKIKSKQRNMVTLITPRFKSKQRNKNEIRKEKRGSACGGAGAKSVQRRLSSLALRGQGGGEGERQLVRLTVPSSCNHIFT